MPFSTLDYSIWALGSALNIALTLLVWKTRGRTHVSLFLAFIFFGVMRSATLFVVSQKLRFVWYFYLYYGLDLISYLLQLGIVYQLFRELFRPYKVLPDRAFQVFLVGSGILLAVIVTIAIQQPVTLPYGRISSMIVDLNRSTNMLQCAVYFFIVVFASALGLPSRHSVVGIALGMGLCSFVNLAWTTMVAQMGWTGVTVTRYLPTVVYLCASLIWIDYFRRPEPVRLALHPAILRYMQRLKFFMDQRLAMMISLRSPHDPLHTGI